MQVTVKLLLPTKTQANVLKAIANEYIRLVNKMVSDGADAGVFAKHASKTVNADTMPTGIE